jgi:hypothetical protein
MKWPSKSQRESFEIEGFIKAYARLPQPIRFSVVSDGPPPGSSGPDFIVVESDQQKRYGVELASVYLSDRSVPAVHMRDDANVNRRDRRDAIAAYERRIVDALATKVQKAKKYDCSHPLILGIHLNEYISIYQREDDITNLVSKHQYVFDAMAPFCEIMFWNIERAPVRVFPHRNEQSSPPALGN